MVWWWCGVMLSGILGCGIVGVECPFMCVDGV